MAKLLISRGPYQGTEIELQPGSNRVGRGPDNDIQIEDDSVSSHHCEISIENGLTRIRDLGSTNGTFIDGCPVQDSPLRPGQRLQLGSFELSYDSAVRVRVAAPPTGANQPKSTPALPSGMSPCKQHATNPAEWLCNRCHQLFCNACVLAKTIGRKPVHVCVTCGGQCTPFGLGVFAKKEEAKSFFSELPEVFKYPLKGNGLILLLGGTIFFGVMAALQRGPTFGLLIWALKIMLAIITGGYLFSYLQKIIQSSAQGDEEMPSWPDFGDYWNDIIRPYFQGVALVLVCLGPAWLIAGKALLDFGLTGDVPVGTIALGVVVGLMGLTYLPMALLAVAMADSMAGINPLFVIPSILKVPVEYTVACCILIAVFIVQVVSSLVLDRIIPLPVVPALLSGFMSLYFLTAEMRLLGLMYYTNKDTLKWF